MSCKCHGWMDGWMDREKKSRDRQTWWVDDEFPTRNMRNFHNWKLFYEEIWQFPNGRMKNFPKFPQNLKISPNRRSHRSRLFAGLSASSTFLKHKKNECWWLGLLSLKNIEALCSALCRLQTNYTTTRLLGNEPKQVFFIKTHQI